MNKSGVMGFVLTFFCVFLSFSANAGSSEYLPYDQLLLKINSADSDVYHGKAYPVRVFNLPPAIKSCSSKDSDLKVVMMTDRQGTEQVFLVVPGKMVPFFVDKINKNMQLEYSFKPLEMYNKFPYLQLVEVISE